MRAEAQDFTQAGVSVWEGEDKPTWEEIVERILPRIDRRMPVAEKVACTAAGALSLIWGFRQKGWFGGLLSLAGVELLTYGISGHHTHELIGLHPRDRYAENRIPFQSGIQVRHSVSINAPIEQVYGYFRDFENLPFFMRHIKNVAVQDQTHSHWTAKGPLGTMIEWDAEIISDEPNKLISWRSIHSPDIESAGSVRFEERAQGKGTRVSVELQYLPPAGAVGAVIAKLFGENPEHQIREDMRCFKEKLEAGQYEDGSPEELKAKVTEEVPPEEKARGASAS